MNDPLLYVEKLEELVTLARDAKTPFEKAAVFSATHVITEAFYKEEEQFSGYALEKVTNARWHICAAVGYDITNGIEEQQHRVWALGDISTLRNLLSEKVSSDGQDSIQK
ncbi:MAG: hypothetical protein J7603_10405 [Pseudacidovorax sp.]|nr:hypothetical protein [Pseudacidovorax sp.]